MIDLEVREKKNRGTLASVLWVKNICINLLFRLHWHFWFQKLGF